MNIQLHIERLVVDGVPMSRHQGAQMQAAVEAELGRLLSTGQLRTSSGGAMPVVQGGVIHGASTAGPMRLGAQIADAVYSGIGERK